GLVMDAVAQFRRADNDASCRGYTRRWKGGNRRPWQRRRASQSSPNRSRELVRATAAVIARIRCPIRELAWHAVVHRALGGRILGERRSLKPSERHVGRKKQVERFQC